jgi:hypothetical protein
MNTPVCPRIERIVYADDIVLASMLNDNDPDPDHFEVDIEMVLAKLARTSSCKK